MIDTAGNYWSDDVTVLHGDCIEVMRTMPDNSVDSIVTDPPYGLGFMGKDWDDLPPGLPWARECLRVLKPGGHLLAFGGSRTWHRLACAVEDAGFEMRDSIAWLYGSGFPKSLNVSNAIKGGLDEPETPESEQWQGWGTALKPAFEPVVVARKPLALPSINVLSRVESELRARGATEVRWSESVSGAVRRATPATSSSTQPQPVAGTSAAPAVASETLNGERPTASDSATSTQPGEKPTGNTYGPTPAPVHSSFEQKSSQPTETPAPAATNEHPNSSPSTTSTEAEPLTARPRGARSTRRSSEKDSRAVTESFAGIATGLTGSLAAVRIDRLDDGSYVWPEGLPISAGGGPATVAANVLAHGTGALNIDGCRISAVEGDYAHRGNDNRKTEGAWAGGGRYANAGRQVEPHSEGRWPANVVLDEDQAAALDQQSGTLTSGANPKRRGSDGDRTAYGDFTGQEDAQPKRGIDKGGASRFFYVAKAPKKERPVVDGVAHPTVKPLALMRWLVRLVTPPGGLVLDPFAGSGTTVEAGMLEGFRVVGIERGAEYLPLILARIDRARG